MNYSNLKLTVSFSRVPVKDEPGLFSFNYIAVVCDEEAPKYFFGETDIHFESQNSFEHYIGNKLNEVAQESAKKGNVDTDIMLTIAWMLVYDEFKFSSFEV